LCNPKSKIQNPKSKIVLPMASAAENKDQQHPQEKKDKEIVDRLLQEEPSDAEGGSLRDHRNYAELARLRIRYSRFPGAREIQKNLDVLLQRWQMSEEQLFELTRQLHAQAQVYRRSSNSQGQDDWS
jgi:hypothetical protein